MANQNQGQQGQGGQGRQNNQNNWLQSMHGIFIANGKDGQMTVTCNGRQLYYGRSWEEAKDSILLLFGLTRQGNVIPVNPTTYGTDTITEVLDTHGLDEVEQAA